MAERKKLSLRSLVFNDKSLILVALILAIIVWIVTSLNIGTDETKNITVHAPIKLSDEFSEQLGMKYYSLLDYVDVKVSISGAKYVIGQVTEDDLSVKFDTSSVNRAGNQTIPIIVTNKSKTKDFSITGTYPNSIDAYFDVEDSKVFDITLVYDKDVTADGYVFGTPVLSEDKVLVTGPKAFVDKIERVNAEAGFSKDGNLTETYTGECKLSPVGRGVESNYITMNSVNDPDVELTSVSVQFPVLKDEYLPVEVEFTDTPAAVNEDEIKVEYSNDYLHVGVLANSDITSAVLGEISYHDLTTGKNTFTFNTEAVQGVILLEDADKEIEVTVTVSDEYEMKEIPVRTGDVTITGALSGTNQRIRRISEDEIKVIVPKGTEIDPKDVIIKADVSEKSDDNLYRLEITLPDSASWVYSEYTAKIY